MSLRLLKLLPDQVAKYWELLSPMVESTLPPIVGKDVGRMNSILESIMSGNMDMLQFYDIEEDKVSVKGFAVVSDMITVDWTEKQLLVYSVYGYENLSKRIIVDGFQLLMEYAAGQGCSSLVAYTNLDGLVKYVKRLGGSADYTFIRMGVDK
jgi:hypothetical protein